MKGENSSNEFFREYLKVYTKSYQGSLTSSSEGILKIFESARNFLNDKKLSNKIIPVIFFDEMGLSELSSNNPLKVIHSQLEYDDNEKKVGFIGISNYCLDASKMNRGIHISIPEPDEDDLITTALSIAGSYNSKLNNNYRKILEYLARSYYKYKKYLIMHPDDFESKLKYNMKDIKEFHGTRDFYYLIKTASELLMKSHYPKEQLGKKQTFYYGSNLEEDISQGHYTAKELNKIQVTMSKENTMILKKLEILYPSLYDLFNQNYRKVGNTKYARIALGNSNTQYYFVHDKFRCIVLLDKNDICKEDPPFINRFEKHIVLFEYLLDKRYIKLSSSISKLLKNIVKIGKEQKINIYLENELINCDVEEINGNLYKLTKRNLNPNKYNDEYFFKKIINIMVPTFSQDIMFFIKNSEFSRIHNKEFQIISQCYNKEIMNRINLKTYLKNINNNKHIIYTFSNIFDPIFYYKKELIEFNNDKYGNFNKKSTKNIYINQYKSEETIDEIISEYLLSNKYNLLICHFNSEDCTHLSHINYLIQNNENILEEKNQLKNKVFILIIHLKRITKNNREDSGDEIICNDDLISHLTKWKQVFIDNLNGIKYNFNEIYESSNTDLFLNKNLIDLDEEFEKDLFHAFTLIKYNFKINLTSKSTEDYINSICKYINNNEKIKCLIKDSIMKKIENIEDNLIMKIFKEYNFEEDDIDFISIIIKNIKSIYNDILVSTIIQFEEQNIISSSKYSYENDINNDYFDSFYQNYINKFNITDKKYSNISAIIKIDVYLGFSYPGIISVFKDIDNCIINNAKSYLNNENEIRFNILYEIDDYLSNKHILENNVITEFIKHLNINYFNNISKRDDLDLAHREKFNNILFEDYIVYFLSKFEYKYYNRNIFKFFKTIFNIFINDNNNNNDNIKNEDRKISIENIAKFSLFLESYKIYIYFLVEFISFMDSNINGFINDFITIISENKFKIINNNIINKNKIKYVNNIFFNIYESVVYCILNIKNFEKISDEIFDSIMKELKIFLQNLMKVNNELFLMLKQILYLNDFMLVSDYFNKIHVSLKENLLPYRQILINENKFYLLKEFDNNMYGENLIKDEFNFLKNKLAKENDYSDLIVKLLNNKIKISKNEEYRKELLNVLCSENTFIIKSKIIFETFLKYFKLCPIDKTDKVKEKNDKEDEYEFNNENNDFAYDDNEFDDETGITFLSKLNDEKHNLIINKLNNTDNIFLNEILLSIFDKEFSIYFNNKKSKENLILNQSFDIFKKCVGYVENEKCEITKNNKLGILYCISYIKMYCYHLSNILISDNEDEISKDNILNFLNIPSEFRKVIKIYILKLLNGNHIGNYKKLVDFVNEKKLFINDFDFTEKVPSSLDYLFIQNESFDDYKQLRDIYILNRSNNFRNVSDILSLINENKGKRIFNFYDLIINEETSNVISNFQKERYKKLSLYTSNIMNNLNLTSISKNLLNIYFDYNTLNNKIKEIQGFSIPKFEMLLYSHKFAFICSLSNSNSVYSKILSPDVINNLENIYIPGGEPNDSRIIRTVREINEYYQNGGKNAIYKCDCNNWYFVGECGYPMEKFKCSECGQLIGGTKHKLVDRPGHVRIYMDEAHRNNDKYRNKYPVSYIFFNQLRADAEKENIPIRGFKQSKRDFFIDTKKQVRNISQVTYRILSFIFYSCIYYNEKLEYINSNDIKKFYYSDAQRNNQSILFIMEEIWKLLIDELIKRNVNNIRCFLNLIIPEITKLIINNNSGLETLEERNSFENKCNIVIENEIANYMNNSETYIRNNKLILDIKEDTMKAILQETTNLDKLPEKYYPLIKYFNITSYPNFDSFNVQFETIPNRNKKYPVITNYLYALNNIKININESLKIFNLINPLITYCLNKYNNKISRKEAKKIKIYKELQNDDNMRILFINFKNGWEKIYKRLSNYDCHGQLPEKNITENDCLAYILNDNLEDGYGKYIATAYKDMITYQNEFLKPLITNDP
eukprot:jgi/Orpsp1_1/1181906/evm.model.c7180000079088.1